MYNFNYGENLRAIRELKSISQFAMAANLQISQSTYSRIESSSAMHDIALNFKIAHILHVAPSELIPRKSDIDFIRMVFGSGLERKTNEILNTQLGLIVLLASLILLVRAAYEITSGICAGLETSPFTKIFVPWAAALGTMVALYFWIKKSKSTDRKR